MPHKHRYHEGPVAFSRDGNQIFFTRNNYQNGQKKTNKKGDTLLKIYTATRNGADWTGIKELAFNSDDYDQCHPTLSADGQVLLYMKMEVFILHPMDMVAMADWMCFQVCNQMEIGGHL